MPDQPFTPARPTLARIHGFLDALEIAQARAPKQRQDSLTHISRPRHWATLILTVDSHAEGEPIVADETLDIRNCDATDHAVA